MYAHVHVHVVPRAPHACPPSHQVVLQRRARQQDAPLRADSGECLGERGRVVLDAVGFVDDD
eukprot:649546-Prymnesium_polylepis.1